MDFLAGYVYSTATTTLNWHPIVFQFSTKQQQLYNWTIHFLYISLPTALFLYILYSVHFNPNSVCTLNSCHCFCIFFTPKSEFCKYFAQLCACCPVSEYSLFPNLYSVILNPNSVFCVSTGFSVFCKYFVQLCACCPVSCPAFYPSCLALAATRPLASKPASRRAAATTKSPESGATNPHPLSNFRKPIAFQTHGNSSTFKVHILIQFQIIRYPLLLNSLILIHLQTFGYSSIFKLLDAHPFFKFSDQSIFKLLDTY